MDESDLSNDLLDLDFYFQEYNPNEKRKLLYLSSDNSIQNDFLRNEGDWRSLNVQLSTSGVAKFKCELDEPITPKRIKLLSFQMFNTIKSIGNNYLAACDVNPFNLDFEELFPNPLPFFIAIPAGNYTPTSLAALGQTLLNAASPNGHTYTWTADTEQFKYTITSTSVFRILFFFNALTGLVLGYTPSSIRSPTFFTPFALSHTSTYTYSALYEPVLFIQLEEFSTSMISFNATTGLPTVQANFVVINDATRGNMFNYTRNGSYPQEIYTTTQQTINSLTISIKDQEILIKQLYNQNINMILEIIE